MRFLPAGLLVVLGLGVALDGPVTSAAQAPSRGLFAVAPVALPDAQAGAQAPDPRLIRQRLVTVNVGALPDRAALPQPGALGTSLLLNVFSDTSFVAALDRIQATPGGLEWVGHVEGVLLSTVTLVIEGDSVAGSIIMPEGAYAIRRAPNDARAGGPALHVVSQINQSAANPELNPIPINAPAVLRDTAAAVAADTAGTIDVMVVYTSSAARAAGGTSGMTSLINLGISETNTSYANSGITQRLRLVGAAEVPYVETPVGSGGISLDLQNLRSGAGGLSGVAGMRDTSGADLVSMIIGPTSEACGIGYLMETVSSGFAANAFSVVVEDCISPNYSFAHELGHNMGARHDWYVDVGSTTSPFSYAHGYVNPASGQHWRTIMAYNNMCVDTGGFNCTRLLYWSNPAVAHPSTGAPMGVAAGTKTGCAGSLVNTGCDADDHLALNNTALTVANFRQAVPSSAAPVVTLHPASVSVTAGQTASFTAAASGSPTPTVQWQGSTDAGGTWTNIPGATATTHAIVTTTSDNGRWFRAVFTNSAGSTATNAAVLTVTLPPTLAPAGDFNGDGKSDVIWQHPSSGAVLLWTMNNSAYMGSTILNEGGTLWQVVGVGDFTGDGKPDLIWQHPESGAVLLWVMNGTTYVSSTILNAGGTLWKVVAARDFTGDGKPDLIWQHPDTGAVLLWEMNGATYVGSTFVNSGGTAWKVAGSGDFNGDGWADLIWQDPDSGAVLLWYLNGAAFSSGVIVTAGGTNWRIAAIADYTGDGKPDLLWQLPSSGAVLLWEMNGATYVSSSFINNGGTLWKVKAPR